MPYITPPIDLFCNQIKVKDTNLEKDFMEKTNLALKSKNVGVQLLSFTETPYFYRIEAELNPGVRIAKLYSAIPEIESALSGQKVSLTVPISEKTTVGIDIEKEKTDFVALRELFECQEFRSISQSTKLALCLGKDIDNKPVIADLRKIHHLLISGTLGTGKSMLLHSILLNLLFSNAPDEARFIIFDSTRAEFSIYNGIQSLEIPVISDEKRFSVCIDWLVSEMIKRQSVLCINGATNIEAYEKIIKISPDIQPLPRLIIFIDNIEDFTKSCGEDCKANLYSLISQGYHYGIHFIISTHRAASSSVSGNIKSAILPRISFRTVSALDSRMILDENGAEHLLSNGDMLCKCVTCPQLVRVRSCLVSDYEIESVVNYIKEQTEVTYTDKALEEIEEKFRDAFKDHSYDDDEADVLDPMFNEAASVVVEAGQASPTMLQKKLKLGYARASRVMDQLEENGIVGPSQGAKPREILISKQEWYERLTQTYNLDSEKSKLQEEFSDNKDDVNESTVNIIIDFDNDIESTEKDSLNQNQEATADSNLKPTERKGFFGLFKRKKNLLSQEEKS